MKRTLAALPAVLLLATMPAPTAAADWELSELGETAIVSLKSAPFPHESRSSGHVYKNQEFPADPHYSDSSVAIFIPKGYRRSERTDLVFYFHGWYNSVAQSLEEFEIREKLVASGKNAILVFPEGPKDAADSGGGRLEEEGALERLADDVLSLLAKDGKSAAEPGQVILSGHSGAYRILFHALKHGGLQVTEVFLLDASYAGLEEFVEWVASGQGRLRSIYTDHLEEENREMMRMLAKRGVEFSDLQEAEVTEEILESRRLVFIHTTELDHNGTVAMLEPWLRASMLEDR